MKKILLLFLILPVLLALVGCGPEVKRLGASVVDGVKSDGRIDSLTTQAMKGLVDGLTTGASKQKLDSLISAVGHQLRLSTDSIVMDLKDTILVLRDSVIGNYLEKHASALADTLTGEKMRKNLSLLMDTLLGKTTRHKVDQLVASAMNTLLSDSNRNKINHLLDSLSVTATSKVGILVDTAVAHILLGTKQLGTQTNTELSTLQRHITPILIGAGALLLGAAALIFYFFRQKEQYARLSGVLTYQIHNTKSDKVFKDITDRVSDNAKRENVEPLLRGLLKDKGILGNDTRDSVPGRIRD